ncbi:MAG: FAD-dependent monooxygenase [Pseudomonadota bacterium]
MSGSPPVAEDGTQRPSVAIAGGGVAGLAAGIALAQLGWQARVFERRPAEGVGADAGHTDTDDTSDDTSDAGAGIQMSPNASRCLSQLDALDRVRAAGVAPQAAVLRDGRSGSIVYRAPLAAAAEARWGAPYLHIHRADLVAALRDAARRAGVDLVAGTTVERWSATGPGVTPQLASADGATSPPGHAGPYDLLLIADGAGSRLRERLGPTEPPRFTGQTAWRALVPADTPGNTPGNTPENTPQNKPGHAPGLAIPHDATVWAAPGRHVVTYRVRAGRMINLVAVEERTRWTEEGWHIDGDPAEMRRVFADMAPPVQGLMAAVRSVRFWGLYDRQQPKRWSDGAVAVIGDACHPMLPFMAQGAAMALEDAVALARHVGARRGDALAPALAAWAGERGPRVARVARTARENGVMFHRSDGLRRRLSHGLIATVSRLAPALAAGQLDWLYGYDAVNGCPARG